MKTQYMLGDDIVVAPVIRRNFTDWKLYIPEVRSVHLFIFPSNPFL